MKSITKELMGASAIPIILSVLKQRDSYGYEIVQMVKDVTEGGINWKEASIYPVLKKLESNKMIKSYWKVQAGERPRRYYSILPEGQKQLEKNQHEWDLIHRVFDLLGGATS